MKMRVGDVVAGADVNADDIDGYIDVDAGGRCCCGCISIMRWDNIGFG